jgi:hypothetical protein
MQFRIRILAAAIGGLLAGAAHAEGFTSIQPGSGLISLDLAGAGATNLGSTGLASLGVGPFTLANLGQGVLVGDASAVTLGDNGSWQAAAPWAGSLTGTAGAFVNGNSFGDNAVAFSLNPGQSTSFVGFRYMVDGTTGLPPGDLSLSVFDSAGTLIATSALLSPVATGGVNESAFIGYQSDTGAIASFRVTGAYHVYGDIGYAQPVPEPGEIAFMLAGRGAAAAIARRRRAARPAA